MVESRQRLRRQRLPRFICPGDEELDRLPSVVGVRGVDPFALYLSYSFLALTR